MNTVGLSQGQVCGSLCQDGIAYPLGKVSGFVPQAGSPKPGALCYFLVHCLPFSLHVQSFHCCLCEFPKLFLLFLLETKSLSR